MAPRARFELATLRLTAECSTIELPGNRVGRNEALLEKCSEEDVRVSMKRGGIRGAAVLKGRDCRKHGCVPSERGSFERSLDARPATAKTNATLRSGKRR
jgi:hypothetical protein